MVVARSTHARRGHFPNGLPALFDAGQAKWFLTIVCRSEKVILLMLVVQPPKWIACPSPAGISNLLGAGCARSFWAVERPGK